MLNAVPVTKLPSGEAVPVLGQGTCTMGEDPRRRSQEVAALRLWLDLGMTLIDTAEMYADGGAERVVAAATAGRRDKVFLISKVLPEHAARRAAIAACERSLKRLNTDRIDLYLLHWRGDTPLEETLEAFTALARALRRRGTITIPRATDAAHARENRAALDLRLGKADLAELDRAFPPPRRGGPLETV